MRYVKWGFWAVLALVVFGFLHYTLPQRDIVRIVGVYTERQDFSGWTSIFWSGGSAGQAATPVNRDVQFIQTAKPNGKVVVFRNEDTGWGWPPYFKFDTADLQAEATDLVSKEDSPRWVVVRHYGWRNQWLSIFPNAVSMRPIDDPNVTLIPWFNIVLILALIALLRTLQVRIRRLWRRLRGTVEEV